MFFDIRLTHAGKFADPLEYLLLRGGRWLRRNAEAVKIKRVVLANRTQESKTITVFHFWGGV